MKLSGLNIALLLTFVISAGCSGGSDSNGAYRSRETDSGPLSSRGTRDSGLSKACRSMCEGTCKALDACNISTGASCLETCTEGIGDSDCSDAHPADQYSCAELESKYEIIVYCSTVCQRAIACGSFDEQLCATGCASERPAIHNPASVPARTCDQIKPEVRAYEDVGRSLQEGDDSVPINTSFPSFGENPYGLCTSADSCSAPLGCDLSTNTCAPCKGDADCKKGSYSTKKYICSSQQECVEVACIVDSDCNGLGEKRCEPETHTCKGCLYDADCASSSVSVGLTNRCLKESWTCVQCLTDADCTSGSNILSGYTQKCYTKSWTCVQCLTDVDCVSSIVSTGKRCIPINDTTGGRGGTCAQCLTDADCASDIYKRCAPVGQDALGVIQGGSCVQCLSNADCTDSSSPKCTYGICQSS